MVLNKKKKKNAKKITGALVHEWPLERVSSGIYICRANIATLWTLYTITFWNRQKGFRRAVNTSNRITLFICPPLHAPNYRTQKKEFG